MVSDEKSAAALSRERVTGEEESAKLKRRRLDGEIRRLELQELHRQGSFGNSELTSWEAAKRALWRLGSFAELDRALRTVEASWVRSRTVLEVAYGPDGDLRTLSARLYRDVQQSVEWVAGLMPDPIVVPHRQDVPRGNGANGYQLKQRNDEILRLHLVDGLNAAQIGRRLGLDRSTVSRLLSPLRSVCVGEGA